MAEAFSVELAERAAELLHLLAHHVRAEGTVRAVAVALPADLLRDVEHDGDGKHVELARDRHQGLARLGLHIRGVDHGEQPAGQALSHDEVQELERITRRGLVVLVIGDQATACIGRHDLGGSEVLAREGGLARARRTDQHHERQLRDLEWLRHDAASPELWIRVKTAIWVGGPVAGSSTPMPKNRTSYRWWSATRRAHASSSARFHSKRWSL